eukprot:m.52307 g.52307  ORF g.52307 m.52307 type:complete len:189 (+) comp9094_c0_seq1:55-621(+)
MSGEGDAARAKRRRVGGGGDGDITRESLEAVASASDGVLTAELLQDTPPRSGAATVKATVSKVLVAVLSVTDRGLEQVAVRGIHEPFNADTRVQSHHEVFRRVTTVAADAYIHAHTTSSSPAAAIATFLTWLASYRTLFSEPCATTGRLLSVYSNGQLLVPFFREYRTGVPGRTLHKAYHEPLALQPV